MNWRVGFLLLGAISFITRSRVLRFPQTFPRPLPQTITPDYFDRGIRVGLREILAFPKTATNGERCPVLGRDVQQTAFKLIGRLLYFPPPLAAPLYRNP